MEATNAKADDPVLFKSVLRTTPKHVYDITHTFYTEFLLSKQYKESPFKRLELEKMVFNNNTVQYQFEDRYYSPFGIIGYVEVTPINDIEAIVKVFCFDRIQSITEKREKLAGMNWPTVTVEDYMHELEGEEEFYKAGRNLLTALANQLKILYAPEDSMGPGATSNQDSLATNKKKRGPNIRTQERFRVFKSKKDAHPGWSLDRVAMESIEELGEIVTGETVRNTYRQMGEKWERADRIR